MLVADVESMLEDYAFLRRLEQRMRLVDGGGMAILDAAAPDLNALARRAGVHSTPEMTAGEHLICQYRAVTEDVRATYLRVLCLPSHSAEDAVRSGTEEGLRRHRPLIPRRGSG